MTDTTHIETSDVPKGMLSAVLATKGILNAIGGFYAANTVLQIVAHSSPWHALVSIPYVMSSVTVSFFLGQQLKNSSFTNTNISLPEPAVKEAEQGSARKPSFLKFNLSTFGAGFAGFSALVSGVLIAQPVSAVLNGGIVQIDKSTLSTFSICAAATIGTGLSLIATRSAYRGLRRAFGLNR